MVVKVQYDCFQTVYAPAVDEVRAALRIIPRHGIAATYRLRVPVPRHNSLSSRRKFSDGRLQTVPPRCTSKIYLLSIHLRFEIMSQVARDANRLVAATNKFVTRFRGFQCRWHSTRKSAPSRASRSMPSPSVSSSTSPWTSRQVGLLAIGISGIGFAAGFSMHQSRSQNRDYARESKFPAPKYASVNEMHVVSISKIFDSEVPNHMTRPSKKSKTHLVETASAWTRKILSFTATPNGHQPTSTRCLWQSPTLDLRKMCPRLRKYATSTKSR